MKLFKIEGSQNANLFRHANGIIYLKIFRASKGQIERSTHTTKLNEARKIAHEILEDWLKKPDLRPKLVSELWADFERTRLKRSKATRDGLHYASLHLLPFFGDKFPNEITEKLWIQYQDLKIQQKPDRKFFDDLKWLNAFLLWCQRSGIIITKPKLENPDPPQGRVAKVYSHDEIKRLLSHANEDLKLQILMGFTMGMRVGEILGLHWDRINLDKNFLVLRPDDTKTRNGRICALSGDVAALLAKRSDRSGFLFKSPVDQNKSVGRCGNKTAWQNCKKLSNVKGRFHDLRATFLTNALSAAKGKVNTTLICKFAGLSTKVAERHYLKPSFEDTKIVSQLVKID